MSVGGGCERKVEGVRGRWRVWEEGGGCDGVSSSGCRVSVRRRCWVKVKSMVVVVIVIV